jgi:hypothetical protein
MYHKDCIQVNIPMIRHLKISISLSASSDKQISVAKNNILIPNTHTHTHTRTHARTYKLELFCQFPVFYC